MQEFSLTVRAERLSLWSCPKGRQSGAALLVDCIHNEA